VDVLQEICHLVPPKSVLYIGLLFLASLLEKTDFLMTSYLTVFDTLIYTLSLLMKNATQDKKMCLLW